MTERVNAVLIGGPKNGTTMVFSDLRVTWLIPVPGDPVERGEPQPPWALPNLRVAVYEQASMYYGGPACSVDGWYAYTFRGEQ